MEIRFKKLDKRAVVPSYAHGDDAGMDIYALEDTTIGPAERQLVRTGITSEIPAGHVCLIWDKSGVSNKRGLKVLGGVIDAGYRGEWLIGLHNLGSEPQSFAAGDKVAQALVQKVEHADIVEVDELSDTARGEGAFGSTGR